MCSSSWAPSRAPFSSVPTLADAASTVRDRVVTERGEIRPHVNVFVGTEAIHFAGGLGAPVTDGCEIAILPAVSGDSLTED